MAVTPDLALVPLGGLGEIGMNCLALEHPRRGERVLIDCGATFPLDGDGVDLIHPRFDYLQDAPLAGLVLTHGHEDHVAAVPFLVHALEQPLDIAGPAYALAICRERLDDMGVEPKRYRMRAVVPGEQFAMGSFGFEPVRVTHSMIDATALAIRTDAGLVVHSGDFKLEADPLDGEPTDEARLEALGDAGVALLLSDSTNALKSGWSGSERTVAAALGRLVRGARGRVVVGLFASNVHRLRSLGAVARENGRHLVLLGRSLRRHADVARRLGKLDWRSDLVVSPEIAATMAPERLLYLATGTQAEPRGALARLAAGMSPDVALGPGDTVILSSRVIPGCERAVQAMCDDLVRLGVELRTAHGEPDVHVTGHAQRDELARMIELTRPQAFVPLHGTLHHLHEHERLARGLGVDRTLVVVDGERAELGEVGLSRGAPVLAGKVAISAGRALEQEVLRERRAMARSGVVLVVLRAPEGGSVEVEAWASGVPDVGRIELAAEHAAREAIGARTDEGLPERVQRAVRQRLGELLASRPEVTVKLRG